MAVRASRILVTMLVACSASMTLALPASAAPPANDDEAGAIRITSVPFTHEQDTTEATASGPRFCSNNSSVFFRLRFSERVRLQLDTIGSDYDTVLAVYRRMPTFRELRCNDDRFGLQSGVRFTARAGVKYFVMVGSCCGNGRNRGGGHLVLTATPVVDEDLAASIAVTSSTFDPETGIATLTGTLTCNERSAAFLEGMLRQLREAGLFVARGYGYTDSIGCAPASDGTWTIEFDTETGVAFGAGEARFRYFMFATDGFGDRVRTEEVLTFELTSAPPA